jgi:phosphoglycerate dehydrogenase-like enzyme
MSPFRLAFSANLIRPNGVPIMPRDCFKRLDETPGLTYEFLKRKEPQIMPDQIQGIHTLAQSGLRVNADTFSEGASDLAAVCLWSLGYDSVDLRACTAAGVAVTRTRGGLAAHSVAAAALSLILALGKRLMDKQGLARRARWDLIGATMGDDLPGKVLGIVGLGDIGRELARLARPFEMSILAYDPYVEPAVFERLGVERVPLDELLARSDYVSLHCCLTPETRGIIGEQQLAKMKSTAYLVNTARGPVLNQRAITDALTQRRIAGAALDVYETEPLALGDPLLTLDNVILTPHCIGCSNESTDAGAYKLVTQIQQIARGEVPEDVLNPEVLLAPAFQDKLAKIRRLMA